MDIIRMNNNIWSENEFDDFRSIRSDFTASTSRSSTTSSSNIDLNSIGHSTIFSSISNDEFINNFNNNNHENNRLINRHHNGGSSKSYCETVSVQDSGSVAQIVGKNGVKIKHLRTKYDVCIRTPSANDEPVFIIYGIKSKVLAAKKEIIDTDNHFQMLKRDKIEKIFKKINTNDAACIRLFIPEKYIGLVVGRGGYFVKEMQSSYDIHIETPKFHYCQYFQLYGVELRLREAIRKISDYIYDKTGIIFSQRIQHNQIDNYDDVYFVE